MPSPKRKSSPRETARPTPNPEVAAGAPEPAKCRAARVDSTANLAYCLAQPADACRFLLQFGHMSLCTHPEGHRIIARTQAAKQAPPAGHSLS